MQCHVPFLLIQPYPCLVALSSVLVLLSVLLLLYLVQPFRIGLRHYLSSAPASLAAEVRFVFDMLQQAEAMSPEVRLE